ncbi:uncharacterized protein LOC115632842 [Scaptodrosophila lebanonensis]|uniref:Uncharacterized protein LOC115632842 n=1 Tax=Drosophila lebanonensis TaxID=7225 RepID=A0A6J2UC41_DROLE|nr:uncharacterized protein LOC115632842 [Scaptodrosophila lebanonensis]
MSNFCTNQAERHVVFKSINATFSPKHFHNFSITIKNNTVNMDMYIIRPLRRGYMAHLEYQMRLANAKLFQTIFSNKFDICNTVGSLKESIIKYWFKTMLKNGNFMQNCPVEVGHYYLHNWQMAVTHRFLQPAEYRCIARTYYGKYKSKTEDHVITFQIEAELMN